MISGSNEAGETQRGRRCTPPPAIQFSIPLAEQLRRRPAKPQRLVQLQHGTPHLKGEFRRQIAEVERPADTLLHSAFRRLHSIAGIGVERYTLVFQTRVEGALPSCPSNFRQGFPHRFASADRSAWQAIFTARNPVTTRTSQTWLRRFNSAFASCPGCKHCSDAAVS